jgi:hypothetical protein
MAKLQTVALRRIDGTPLFRLTEDYAFRSSRGVTWTVRSGFVTDGASIPSIFYSLIGPPVGGEYTEAAVLHDAVCRSGWIPLRDCDKLMHEVMVAHGTPDNIVNPIMLALTFSRLWRRRVRPSDSDALHYLDVSGPI